jgi:hypothetical protein
MGRAATLANLEGDMRSLIKLAALVLVLFVGIGFCLGWFSVTRSHPEPEGEEVNINMSVDKAKMKSDIKKAEGKVEEKVKGLKDKVEAKKAEE